MKHARQNIREAVATTLGAITATVYRSRVYPLDVLPVIAIYGNNETATSENDQLVSQKRYTRLMDLNIEIVAEAVADVDDEIDDLAAQVEALLGADPTLTATAVDSNLLTTTIELDGSGDKPLAVCTLLYQVWYRTTAADAQTSITS